MSMDFKIAGPCSVESEEQVLLTAKNLVKSKPDFFVLVYGSHELDQEVLKVLG